MEYDFSDKAKEFLESQAAKRPARKSGAQTPAKPSERKKGSKKNPKGSAGGGKKAPKITFSEKVLNSLKEKVRKNSGRGQIVIEYFSHEDFERLYELLIEIESQ